MQPQSHILSAVFSCNFLFFYSPQVAAPHMNLLNLISPKWGAINKLREPLELQHVTSGNRNCRQHGRLAESTVCENVWEQSDTTKIMDQHRRRRAQAENNRRTQKVTVAVWNHFLFLNFDCWIYGLYSQVKNSQNWAKKNAKPDNATLCLW